MFDTSPDEPRGFHAHKELEQLVIAIDGACEFVLDDGKSKESVWLNRPDFGLYIGKICGEKCGTSLMGAN